MSLSKQYVRTTVYVNSNNWSAWKAQAQERALEFSEAGKILRSKASPIGGCVVEGKGEVELMVR